MPNVPLAENRLKVATPLAPGEWPSNRSASPAGSPSAPRANNNHPQTLPTSDLLPRVLAVEEPLPLSSWMGKRSLLVSLTCVAQLIVHEVPAWMVSMVVHMVTLVTMAMVTVAGPVKYTPQHLIITPPEEKIEEVVDVDKLPTRLEPTATIIEPPVIDAKLVQEDRIVDPNNELEAAPAAMTEPNKSGMDYVSSGDALSLRSSSGKQYFARPWDVEKYKKAKA